jgi:hypothetical protein
MPPTLTTNEVRTIVENRAREQWSAVNEAFGETAESYLQEWMDPSGQVTYLISTDQGL